MIPYGTEEWYAARLGKVTASRGACIVVNGKGPHGLGEGALTYAMEVVSGMMGIAPEQFSTPDMEEGVRREEESFEAYEERTFRSTSPGGLILIPGTIIGATPDAFVDDDGQLQAKNPRPKAHFETLMSRSVPAKYKVQIQWELMVTGRKWCDFVSYCPFFPYDKAVVIVRVLPDHEWIEGTLRPKINAFIRYVDELKETLGVK